MRKDWEEKIRNLFAYAEKGFNKYCTQIEQVYTKEFLNNSLNFDDFLIQERVIV